MDDMTALERQLGTVLDRMGGPEPSFDATEIASEAATTAPAGRWTDITRGLGSGRVSTSAEGGFSMFSALKIVAAATVVALFGGFLLLALPGGQETAPVPAASSSAPAVTDPTESVTPRPTPEEWGGLEATDPRPDTQPDHPLMNVGFGKYDGTGTADWRSGPSDWRVNDLAREGMELSPLNMAIGPDWDVWQHDHGACGDTMQGEEVPCIWQVGVPGVVFLPDGVELIDLAVGPDGVIWGVSQEGFVAFDGHQWVEHDHDIGREDDASLAWAVAADGSAWLLEERSGGRFRLLHATWDGLEQIDVAEPSGTSDPGDLAYALAVSSDGPVWVTGEPAACFPCPDRETRVGFVARFDGEDWIQENPLGGGSALAAAKIAAGPDGSLWAYLESDDSSYLARHDGSDWMPFELDEALPGIAGVGGPLLVGSDGAVWFEAWFEAEEEGGGVMSFDGESWSKHLAWPNEGIRDMAAAPDGGVWVSVEDDGVYAVSR